MGKITQEIAQKVINEYCQGSSSYELADKYGLWQTSVCNLISGRTWKKCERPDNIDLLIKNRHEKGWMKKGQNDHLHEKYPKLTNTQMEIINGSLLGDGSFNNTYPNSRFSKQQCVKYQDYLTWHQEQLSVFSKPLSEVYSKEKLFAKNGLIVERRQVPKFLAAYGFRTCSHPIFTSLRNKWYPDGKKIVPSDLKLTPLSIAVWFFDDGCNSAGNREAIIATQSFTCEEADFLCQLLKEFKISPQVKIRISKTTGIHQPLLKCNARSYDNLIKLITPFMLWNCMSHKVKYREAQRLGFNQAKLSEEDVLKIYELSETHKQCEIAEIFNIHKVTISSILRGKSWTHLSHHNRYIPKNRSSQNRNC